jgi:hypothetical protein
MIWGEKSVNQTPFVAAGTTHLLGFNEPNSAGQSNLSPARAAALWPAVVATARTAGLSLVSPAPAGNGVAWLDAFFAACGGCLAGIDAIAQHTYACSADALRSDLGLYVKYGKPIWVTEFNCGDGSRNASAPEHRAYMEAALPILDADPHIERWVEDGDRQGGGHDGVAQLSVGLLRVLTSVTAAPPTHHLPHLSCTGTHG